MSGIEFLLQSVSIDILLILLAAGLVQGIFGIGFPMVATTLLALTLDVRSAVLLTLVPTLAVNLATISWGGGLVETLRRHWPLLVFVLLGTIIGTRLLIVVDPRPFLLLLAGAILLYLNQQHLQRLDLGWVRDRPWLAYILFGLAAGVMAGTVNVMVPVLIILALELGIPAASMILLFNLNFLIGKLGQAGVFIQGDLLSLGDTPHLLVLVPFALAGLLAGMRIRRGISEERYRKILRAVLWSMAGMLVLRFAAG